MVRGPEGQLWTASVFVGPDVGADPVKQTDPSSTQAQSLQSLGQTQCQVSLNGSGDPTVAFDLSWTQWVT